MKGFRNWTVENREKGFSTYSALLIWGLMSHNITIYSNFTNIDLNRL